VTTVLCGGDSVTGGSGTLSETDQGGWVNALQPGSGAVTLDSNNAVGKEVQFASGIADDQLWFSQQGANLVVSVIGTAETETLTNWYYGAYFQVADFKTSDGRALQASQVNNLVNAMASFSPPAMGQMTLSPSVASQLEPVIAANWH